MPGATESTGPTYISSHSADVILSEIRPIKLKLEGLRSINVLLDEFLFNILNTSRSLSTDRLRASLLSILPTSLGKEALLEAEVELRAYWERTARPTTLEDDAQTFNLQWSFELLRLKCEAYSTLNESDEDSAAVAQLQERMAQLGGTTPPIPSLVAPASLYLTAILESMCEHILSNVGRVAARDSSRANATVQDVFVALCEDHSIYELFKSMRVYQQIELLSQTPKPRRSKSISRSDRPSLSRGSNQDFASSSSQHRSRGSTDTSATTSATSTTTATLPPSSSTTSRSSFDKARMKKLMTGSRSSTERDGDSQSSHKRSESVLSEETKQTLNAYNLNESDPEDSAMIKEFDNLMRSDSTMKVSLTPDRLKTMEVYKQEKDGRGNRRPPPLAFPDTSSGRANGRRPSLRHVDSIVEDEEEPTSNTSSSVPPNKSSRSNPNPPLPMSQARRGPTGPAGFDSDPFPVKTRRIQKNRESLDLDAVMAGSDDEDADEQPAPPRTPSRNPAPPTTPRRQPSTPRLASSAREGSTARDRTADTRDMIDFLNSGPPPPKVSAASRDMMDFLSSAPPDHGAISSNSVSSIESGKKGSGRLQRMMSKLAMGTSEKSRSQSTEDPSRGSRAAPPTTPVRTQGITHQTSYGNLSSLANRPVPPRPPPIIPISPPASPSDDEYHNTVPRTRKTSAVAPGGSISQPGTPRRVMPTWEQQMADGQPPVVPTKHVESANGNGSVNGNGYKVNGNGHVRAATAEEQSPRSPSSRRPSAAAASAPRPKPEIQTQPLPIPQPQTVSPASRKPPPVVAPPATPTPPAIAEDQARDMRRLLARATNADECRLLFDIFLAKSGVPVEPTPSFDVPYPSPSLSDNAHPSPRDASEVKLELALVELFLGGDEEQAAPQRPRRSKKRSEAAPVVADVPVPDGVTQPRKYVTFAVDAPPARTVSEVGA